MTIFKAWRLANFHVNKFKWFFLAGTVFMVSPAWAGALNPQQVAELLDGKYIVGELLADLPAYPLFTQNKVNPSAKPDLTGYAFETIDLEPVRGYSGKPINLLVVMDAAGVYRDVRLVEHKEPFFLTPIGTTKLGDFASQYIELSLKHSVELLPWDESGDRDDQSAHLSGVHHGTVTAKAINRSILSAAAQVAQSKIPHSGEGMAAKNRAGASLGRSQSDNYTPLSLAELLHHGLVTRTPVTVQNLQDMFAQSKAPFDDLQAHMLPYEEALVFHTALLADPLVGRNLLDDEGWRYVTNKRRTQQALLITLSDPLHLLLGQGKWKMDKIPFTLVQNSKEIQLIQVDFEKSLRIQTQPAKSFVYVLLTDKSTPLNPSQSFELRFNLHRSFGINFVLNKTENRSLPLEHRFHGWRAWLTDLRFTNWMSLDWVQLWISRQVEIGFLLLGLVVLSAALGMQKTLSRSQSHLRIFRTIFLIFTLGFIGWFAQGQLTILNITSAISSLSSGGDLSFLLNDPISFILWIFVIASLFVWGRGTFCGWLCPFGALQELLSMLANAVGWHQRRWRQTLDKQLKKIKYVCLALILFSMWLAPSYTDSLTKLEPFETAISFYFVHDWPYVLWAVVSLGLGLVVYRGYCRYLCPLGAALAAVNFLQRWAWIPRRDECGAPCQSCKHRCEYQAIEPSGKIEYAECFQCLDCVAIYQDEERCLPLILSSTEVKTRIPIHALRMC